MISSSYEFQTISSTSIAFQSGSKGSLPNLIDLGGSGFLGIYQDAIAPGNPFPPEGMTSNAFTVSGVMVPETRIIYDAASAFGIPSGGIGLGSGVVLFNTSMSGSSTVLRGQLVNAAGSALEGTPFTIASVASTGTCAIGGVELASLSDGGFVATWGLSAALGDLRSAVFNADGSARTTGFDLAVSASNETAAQVAGLTSGGFVQAWLSTNASGITQLFAQRFTASGAAENTAVMVKDFGTTPPSSIDLLGLPGGAYVLAYGSMEPYSSPASPFAINTTLVHYSIFEANGAVRVSDVVAPVTGSPANNAVRSFNLQPLSDGLFGISTTGRRDFRGTDYSFLVFDESGTYKAQTTNANGVTTTSRYFDTLSDGSVALVSYDRTFGSNSITRMDLQRTLQSDGAGDLMIGDGRAEKILGNAGNDTILGGGGHDMIDGGADNDSIDGGAGNDTISGGDGDDTILYDVADTAANVTGGAGTDTLRIINGNVPTGFNLGAQGFEIARHEVADTTNQVWSTIADIYNASWQRQRSTIQLDDGTSQERNFDFAGNQTYIEYINYSLDTAFPTAVTRQVIFEDAGTKQERFFDYRSNQAYSEYVNQYLDTALPNAVTCQIIFEDAGTKQERFFDYKGNQAYSEYINFYADTALPSAVTRQVIFEDLGTKQERFFDYKSNQVYSEYVNFYADSALPNAVTRQVVFEDGGTKQERIFDYNNTEPTYSEVINFYNVAGAVYRQVGFNDAGAVAWEYFY